LAILIERRRRGVLEAAALAGARALFAGTNDWRLPAYAGAGAVQGWRSLQQSVLAGGRRDRLHGSITASTIPAGHAERGGRGRSVELDGMSVIHPEPDRDGDRVFARR
jgi:hypothetical protein